MGWIRSAVAYSGRVQPIAYEIHPSPELERPIFLMAFKGLFDMGEIILVHALGEGEAGTSTVPILIAPRHTPPGYTGGALSCRHNEASRYAFTSEKRELGARSADLPDGGLSESSRSPLL